MIKPDKFWLIGLALAALFVVALITVPDFLGESRQKIFRIFAKPTQSSSTTPSDTTTTTSTSASTSTSTSTTSSGTTSSTSSPSESTSSTSSPSLPDDVIPGDGGALPADGGRGGSADGLGGAGGLGGIGGDDAAVLTDDDITLSSIANAFDANGDYKSETSFSTCKNLLGCADAVLKLICETCSANGWPPGITDGPLVIYDVRVEVNREDNHTSTARFTWKTNKQASSRVYFAQGVRFNKKNLHVTKENLGLDVTHQVIAPYLPNSANFNFVVASRTKDEKAQSDVFDFLTLRLYDSLWGMLTNILLSSINR